LCYNRYMNMANLKPNKLFWFLRKNGNILNVSDDRNLIIHQTLALGSMDDVRKIFHQYGKDIVRQEFEKPVRGLYAPSVLRFFEFVLGVKLKNSEQYLKNMYGKVTPRHS